MFILVFLHFTPSFERFITILWQFIAYDYSFVLAKQK